LNQSVANLVQQQQQQSHHDEEDSVNFDFEAAPAAHGRGGGHGIIHGLRGRGFVLSGPNVFLNNCKTMVWVSQNFNAPI
jgi:hypothetical protein